MKARSRAELEAHIERGNTVKYVLFWGHQKSTGETTKCCFSQWYDSPYEYGGKNFPTSEHHMMYQKAILFGDSDASERVLSASSPGEAKAIGRQVTGFDQAIWDANRFDIVVMVNRTKFSAHAGLKKFLVNTGSRVLAEASPVDKVWGIGLAEDNPACQNPSQWRGENLLGFALMEVRESFD